jgi:hypothetical protein
MPYSSNVERLLSRLTGGCSWPGPDSRWDSRKLTSVSSVIASEVRFLMPPRTHDAGYKRSWTVVCIPTTKG